VAVRRVLAQADVRQQQQLGKTRPQRAQRALDDAVVDPRARALVVLVLGNPEENHRPHAEPNEVLDLAHDVVDAEAAEGREQVVSQRPPGPTNSGITN
jgi:hypothetical protein